MQTIETFEDLGEWLEPDPDMSKALYYECVLVQ